MLADTARMEQQFGRPEPVVLTKPGTGTPYSAPEKKQAIGRLATPRVGRLALDRRLEPAVPERGTGVTGTTGRPEWWISRSRARGGEFSFTADQACVKLNKK
ncbi:MAG: hypothetical protein V1816_24570 [Pseudomonadota bacterium]